MQAIAVFTTVGSLAEARKLAHSLVERQLAACAQISEIESVYCWQGEKQNEREFRVLFKTESALYSAVESAIRELHSYELPAIYALPVEQIFAPYAEWVSDSIKQT
jgi:periplasmic divalent cation tolerance protein